jgi:hypothetical protein
MLIPSPSSPELQSCLVRNCEVCFLVGWESDGCGLSGAVLVNPYAGEGARATK